MHKESDILRKKKVIEKRFDTKEEAISYRNKQYRKNICINIFSFLLVLFVGIVFFPYLEHATMEYYTYQEFKEVVKKDVKTEKTEMRLVQEVEMVENGVKSYIYSLDNMYSFTSEVVLEDESFVDVERIITTYTFPRDFTGAEEELEAIKVVGVEGAPYTKDSKTELTEFEMKNRYREYNEYVDDQIRVANIVTIIGIIIIAIVITWSIALETKRRNKSISNIKNMKLKKDERVTITITRK